MSEKPNVIIFGGVNTCARALAAYLAPPSGEDLVSNLRIVDKYSVNPPTTYIGSEFPKVLEKPNVEYHQANLTQPATVSRMFDPPEGQAPYTYVFDLTGDIVVDRPEAIYINHTCNVTRLLGLEAAKRNIKAFVRLQQPFYECSEKGSHEEKDDVKPNGVVGTWWHESLRILGAVGGLNLVVVRPGLVYGPYIDSGLMTNVLTVASVYGYMKKPMKSLWSPGKNPMNTIHSDDVAGALWACAQWMAPLGRAEADKVAGEEVHFHNEKSKVSEVTGMPPATQKVVVPLFNIVDDNQTTLHKAGETMTSLFGTTFEYHNFLTNTVARFRLEEAVEDINEAHVGAWAEMITKSNPPCPNTHLSAYMDTFTLSKHVVALSNAKIRKIIGYTLKQPSMTAENLREIVDKWKEEGSWPKLD
ncbi:NAD-P-binding protein [Stereum hirsutum FP-91666 SS1]|uniref:NAD-P-binding protein n=1 Tax=Stereum hirsutum (strain FP-91666) TaxID=721885 RepID=UPI000440C3DE|nr:NAD-P-binding protein [Stereum hirsutum FP-91666 SS1]EIM90215.1 NAD-P-binding protein [Stereum hirsutum FP-91666 SS1]